MHPGRRFGVDGLFNGFLAGVSLDGERWLYVNPLQARDGHTDTGGDHLGGRQLRLRTGHDVPGGRARDARWTLVAAGSGLYKIRQQASGLLLGITDAGTGAGGTALIWGDNGTADHLWQPIPSGDGYYKIANYHSGLLLGVTGMSTSSGAQVLQWDDNGTADHLWKLTAR
ncbi:RICIN domain-containing protein [Streptomyces sp. NPDC056660]|uniref:RICIN domain-containing protein n=1 Tax=Streptomyces sp. NPDC056660 TaxID=3345897 RepID=UPI0036D10C71